MPAAKQSIRFSPARLVFLSAVVTLIALVVWVAVRAVGPSRAEAVQPIVVLPSMPTVPVGTDLPSASPSPSRSGSPTPTLTASPSPSRSPSATPSVRRSPHSPTPTRRSPTPPAASFRVTVTVTGSWPQGYVAMVQVVNNGPKAASWSVTVSHSGLAGLHLGGIWNGQGHQSGNSFVFTGGSLNPGQTVGFGYQAGAQSPVPARPSGCSVTAGSCRVS